MSNINSGFISATLALAFGLSGCVGGGGGSDTYEAALTSATATSAKASVGTAKYDVDGFERLAGEFNKLDRPFHMWKPAIPQTTPLSGSATYNGIAAFGDDASLAYTNANSPEMLASMALTVDFGTAKVQGAMWDFHDKNGKVGNGSVSLKGTQESTKFTASGSSTIYWGDVNQDIDVTIDGYFLANEKGIKGTMANTLEGANGTDISQAGVIILKRDDMP